MVVQGLRPSDSIAGGTGSIPGQGAEISHAVEQLRLCATTAKPEHHD